jgi:hypothetical protein
VANVTNSLNAFLGDDFTRASEINPVFSCSAVCEPALSFCVCEGGREFRAVQRHIPHGYLVNPSPVHWCARFLPLRRPTPLEVAWHQSGPPVHYSRCVASMGSAARAHLKKFRGRIRGPPPPGAKIQSRRANANRPRKFVVKFRRYGSSTTAQATFDQHQC